MKAGLTLQEWATEIARQNEAKADYLLRTSLMAVEAYGSQFFLRLIDQDGNDQIEPLEIGAIAHRQMGAYMGIPAKYYNRMMDEAPPLLAYNANYWLVRDSSQHIVRSLDGVARAFLSTRYRRIDNYEVASAILPVIGEMAEARFVSCQITESYMYMKVVNPQLQAEIAPGDFVQAGIAVRNSEVGQSSLRVQPLIYWPGRGIGAIVNDDSMRRNHSGAVVSSTEDLLIFNQDKTLSAKDRNFLLEVQKTAQAAVSEDRFQEIVQILRDARDAQMNIEDIPGVVRLAAKEFDINEEESNGVLQHLMAGNDFTRYGLANAVTRQSQDVESYDRASDLEAISYDVMAMGQTQWNRMNQAA